MNFGFLVSDAVTDFATDVAAADEYVGGVGIIVDVAAVAVVVVDVEVAAVVDMAGVPLFCFFCNLTYVYNSTRPSFSW